MQRTLAVFAAAAGLLALALPAPASAARNPGTATPSILTFAAGAGRADVVATSDAGSAWTIQLAGGTAPSVCGPWLASFWCSKTGVERLSVATLDGDDQITLKAGIAVTVDAGDGNDRIDARNGVADVIDCGAGDDRATADAADAVANCEVDPPVVGGIEPIVDATPVTGPEDDTDGKKDKDVKDPAPPSAVAGSLPLVTAVSVLTGPVVQIGSDGSAPLTVGCGTDQAGGCAGTVYLDPLKKAKAKGKGKGKRKQRTGAFGSVPFTAAAGQAVDVGVPLTAAARKALGLASPGKARAARRGRRVKAVVTVVPKGKGKAKQRAVVELRT